jgi:uncharacterized oligopeptide transporter (OPT) family protein
MQDLKTGALLKASPRSQFYGQMIGSFASVFVSVGAYKLYTSIYEVCRPQDVTTLPLRLLVGSRSLDRNSEYPRLQYGEIHLWSGVLRLLPLADLLNCSRLNLARLLNTGHLPPYTAVFMAAFGSVFALLSFIKYLTPMLTSTPPRWIHYIPSGIAFAIGFLNTPSFSLARLVGGYIAYRTRKNGETPLLVIVCASGFVLGEGIISIVGLVMTGAGKGALSCWGCGLGGGGYCSGGC